MQLSLFTTVVTLLAGAGMVHAGVAGNPAGQQAKRQCEYKRAGYLSRCTVGETLFCSGNTDVCGSGNDDFDATATKANEDACAGQQETDSCIQTVMCC